MDNNDLSSPTSPGSSGSPHSGSMVKWLLGVVAIPFGLLVFSIVLMVVSYKVGTSYLSKPQVIDNLQQTIEGAIGKVSTVLDVPNPIAQFSTPTKTNSALDNAAQKVTTVLICINYADESIRDTITLYKRNVDFAIPAKTKFLGLSSDASWQACDKALTSALSLATNTLDLDQALRDFQVQGNAIVAAFRDVTSYYKQKDYLDDNFTFGKAKDAALIPLSLAYLKASDIFRDAVDAQEDSNNKAYIAALSADPAAKNQLLALQMFMQSKAVLHELYKEPMNSSALEESINNLTSIQNKFKDVVLVSLKNDTTKYSIWSGVSNKVDSFIAASKNTWRLVRDNTSLPENHEGSLDQAIEQFNNLVTSYNVTNNIPQYRL